MKFNTAQPYIASYVIFRKDNKVAFVLRSNTNWMNNFYGLPSGKVEVNEPFAAAAIREAKEEVGVDIKPNQLKHVLTMHRKEPSDNGMTWVDLFFEAEKWSGELINAEPHMHSELTWLDVDNLPENVISSVLFALDHIKKGSMYCEYGWD